MAHIRLDQVNLKYPIRRNKGIFLKEFFLHGFFLKKNTMHIHALRDVATVALKRDADDFAVLHNRSAAVAGIDLRADLNRQMLVNG